MIDTELLLLDPVVTHAAAAAVAVIFLSAAVSKLRDPALFEAVVENYDLLPRVGVRVFAWAIPVLELAAGISLLPVSTRASGAGLAITLLAIMGGAVMLNLLRGKARMDCGCGGGIEVPLSWALMVRISILAATAGLAGGTPSGRSLDWLDGVSVIMTALFLIGLYYAANLWLANQSHLNALRKKTS